MRLTTPTVDRGRFDGRIPYYRAGDGPETLVVLPGLSDAFSGSRAATAAHLARTASRGLTDDFTVWTVGRPRDLDPDATTRDLAGAVATALDELDGGHVLGCSMGGLVAQHLAADYPDHVDRLVLAAAGAHVGDAGRAVLNDWETWAASEEWGKLYASVVRETYAGWRRRAYPALLRAVGPALAPPSPDDVLTSIRAVRDHDASERLEEVTAPTLVLGGSEDRLFPADLLRETKAALPDATLALLSGAGHAAASEHPRVFGRAVKRFLRGEQI
ncbi:alpha/beta hydrolase [Halogeometricum sp. S1BR25-6]|uniref:Alpha/beta hydrolase n=1 Tax=Halogeometricum salsisoli TaxID=2950536 RepID=A0ABU2GFA3_9EURY|nr:alpha/beta fold hydrolase [Halogeometricum sp. S1BR25-6]MDS0298884.1 alpha/beta hydrolase [Halogeometricum sp. S1BR25-6]